MSELIPLLNIEDVTRSIALYETILGAIIENQWENEGRIRWARLSFEGGKLMLNTPDSASSGERQRRAEFSDPVLYLMCDDAIARRPKLLAAGMTVSALHEEEYGNDEFAVRDPLLESPSPRGGLCPQGRTRGARFS